MKSYEVELKHTGYVVITVEAENTEDAEAKAWEKLTTDAESCIDNGYGNWEIESIEKESE
jgi:hypothetical protein